MSTEELLKSLHHEFSLGSFGGCLMNGNQTGIGGQNRNRALLGARGRNHLRGQGNDVAIRAVIPGEAHDLRIGKIRFKLFKIANIGPSKTVDRLIRVADGTHITIRRHQLLNKTHLLFVNVLIFVNAHPTIALTIGGFEARLGFQQIGRPPNEVVVIHQVLPLQCLSVDAKCLGESVIFGDTLGAFEMGDRRQQTTRPLLRNPEVLAQKLQALSLSGNAKTAL